MIAIEDNLLEAPTGRNNVVYIISRKDTGEVVYVGKTIRFAGRQWQHRNPRNWLRHKHSILYSAFRKYGPDAFDFEIFACYKEEQLAYDMEAKLISIKKPRYNIMPGGQRASVDIEIRKQWNKGTVNEIKSVKAFNFETRELCEFKSINEASRDLGIGSGRISEILNPEKNPLSYNSWVFSREEEPNWEELIDRVRNTQGYPKKVKGTCIKTNEVFEFASIHQAAGAIKGNPSHITAVCRGKRKKHKNYRWEYVL